MTAQLTQAEAVTRLRAVGFRVRTGGEYAQVIKAFKTGWLLGPDLLQSGVATVEVGPLTSAAISLAYERAKDGKSTMSPHFSWTETACKCARQFAACRLIWPTRASVVTLEKLRTKLYPNGLRPVSWCRCPGHNTLIKGATASRHMIGDAVDIDNIRTIPQVTALGLYGGLGVAKSNRCVSHVDNRPGSRTKPTTWWYPTQ